MKKIEVAILGATGMVGQRFLQLLAEHPWFEVTALIGSERSAGQRYGAACTWVLAGDIPAFARDMRVLGTVEGLDTPIVFSALPSSAAGAVEEQLARAGHVVCSNAGAHRMDPDVPLLVPEVNPDHLGLIAVQRQRRGWSGALVTNPNCTATPIVMAFRPLHDAFTITQALVVSMQGLSGAGYPGVSSLDALDNVVPFIGGEEEKVESEPQKMLGRLVDQVVVPAPITISAHCNRVAVIDGHTECVSLSFEHVPSQDDLVAALRRWRSLPQELQLPSAPAQPVVVLDQPNRPQPRRDRDTGNGMATVVGRIRPCSLLQYKMVLLAHNTIRGAAGGSILNAELMVSQGIITTT